MSTQPPKSNPHPGRRDVIKGTIGVALATQVAPASAATSASARQTTSFDLGWRFRRGEGEGFQDPSFDDSAWRLVDVPHDWSIEDLPDPSESAERTVIGPFDSTAEGASSTGFTLGGDAWYRKRFQMSPPPGGRVEVLFESVYMNSEVWLNGRRLGEHAEGYTPFAYDLTPHLSADGDNVIAVHVRNRGRNSRWYSGSGIHRHTWIDVFPEQARLARWGVGVATTQLTSDSASLEISTKLESVSAGLDVVSRIRDPNGRTVWRGRADALSENLQRVSLRRPLPWSPDTPVLYTLETELRRGRAVLDRRQTTFGIRVIAFDAERGMLINGVPTKMRGGCIHADNGFLGAASFDAAEDRKVRLMRERGYNAVRPSHNLFPTAFYEACDRHGLMVVCDTFDAWNVSKSPQDYGQHFETDWRADLATIVNSTRNHPSIVAWCIGNEIPGRNEAAGIRWQWELTNEVHRLDPTRPVTAAINGFAGRQVTPSAASARVGSGAHPDRASVVFLDLVGYNYKLGDYESDQRLYPGRIFLGTESYPKDVAEIWRLTERTPWLVGDFVWTAMDYLGEAGVGRVTRVPAGGAPSFGGTAWPWINAYCGDIDLIGQRKPPARARDVVWSLSTLEMAVQRPVPEGQVENVSNWGWSDELESWTWPGAEGKPLAVRIYTSGDRVDLLLNGTSVGTQLVPPENLQRAEFSVPYAPGTIEAVAYRDGVEIGRRSLTTVGAPAALRLTPETRRGASGRGDVSFVLVEVLDAQGRLAPDAEAPVRLEISGPGDLAAFGSATPFAVGGFQSPSAPTWHGRALAIIRGQGRAGEVRIAATSPGLSGAATTLQLG